MIAQHNEFDFIVVGGGPAGCAVAARLAGSAKAPSVLLVEAGGPNNDKNLRVDGERWTSLMDPSMNWSYKTTPQPELNNREIDYSRGKGLGGSSAINFSVYDVGPADDFEEIARLADDPSWGWNYAQQRFKALETFHAQAPALNEKYVQAKPEDHGSAGKLHIGFAKVAERSFGDTLRALEESGCKLNPDINSGDPLGWGPCPSSAYNGLRTTSADLILDGPSNLTVMTDQKVNRIIFEESGTKAVGIETDATTFYATKEIVLSCGSLDTPKLLLLSGVGPADELKRLDIPVVRDVKYIGKGLRDHIHIEVLWKRADHTSDKWRYYRSPEAIAAARKQWEKDQTGPLAEFNCSFVISFNKSEQILRSKEFDGLSDEMKQHLRAKTVPLYETIVNCIDFRDVMDPTQSEASMPVYIFLLNGQSRGEVTLRSKDPKDPPVSDPRFLSDPFDRRVAIEATRETMQLMQSPPFSKDTTGVVKLPKSDSDEDILEYWRANSVSTWHVGKQERTSPFSFLANYVKQLEQ
jgi:choline dehydrogenase-like flavoprotein